MKKSFFGNSKAVYWSISIFTGILILAALLLYNSKIREYIGEEFPQLAGEGRCMPNLDEGGFELSDFPLKYYIPESGIGKINDPNYLLNICSQVTEKESKESCEARITTSGKNLCKWENQRGACVGTLNTIRNINGCIKINNYCKLQATGTVNSIELKNGDEIKDANILTQNKFCQKYGYQFGKKQCNNVKVDCPQCAYSDKGVYTLCHWDPNAGYRPEQKTSETTGAKTN